MAEPDIHPAVDATVRALVLTISDGVAAGTREDSGGAGLAERVEAAGYRVRRARGAR